MLRKISALLAATTALVHTFVGGRDALAPMLAAGLTPASEAAMHACWHMVTFLLLWSVVVFWNGGKPAFHFAVVWIGSAIVFIYVGIAQGGMPGIIANPQWTIIGLTGILAMLCCKFRNNRNLSTEDKKTK